MKNLHIILGLVLLVSLNSQSFWSQNLAINTNLKKTSVNNFIPKNKKAVNTILTEGNYTYVCKGKEVLVKIKDGYYKENYENNEFIEAKINWISENEYSLTITDINKKNLPFKKGTQLNTKIIKVKNNKYYYESNLNGLTWTGNFKKE